MDFDSGQSAQAMVYDTSDSDPKIKTKTTKSVQVLSSFKSREAFVAQHESDGAKNESVTYCIASPWLKVSSYGNMDLDLTGLNTGPYEEVIMDTDVLYFIAYPGGDHTKITVIDLAYTVSYQRNDWANVNDKTYDNHQEAIDDARQLAVKYNLAYVPFDSRYNSSLSECVHPQLSLDDEE